MKRKIGTQLEDEVYQELKVAAAQQRRAISELIEVAISDYLKRKKRRPGHRSGLERFLDSPAFKLTDDEFRQTIEADFYDQ
jgi:predicted transcriptional regulator